MTRGRITFLLLSLMVVVPIVSGALLSATDQDAEGEDSLFKYLSVFTDVLSLVQQAYVEETDIEKLMVGALEGATDALDPFSAYVPAADVQRFLAYRERAPRPSGLLLLKERGVLYVAGVDEGSPASEAGVQLGDLLSRIDGQSTRDLAVWEVSEILAGTEGSVHELEVVRLGEGRSIELRLARYEVPVTRFEEVREIPVLRIGRFGSETVEAVEGALARCEEEGRSSLLLDLRGVGGGEPEVAFRVAGLFAGGELGSLRDRWQVRRRFAAESPVRWGGDLGVLVDGGSLGAAEILAAILQQTGSAKLIGEPTFGHAGHQELLELSSGARLLLTAAFYTGPDGEPLDRSVDPDLLVDEGSRKLSEEGLSLQELILERGVRLLRGEETLEPVLEQAA